jgi:hypothetical protein
MLLHNNEGRRKLTLFRRLGRQMSESRKEGKPALDESIAIRDDIFIKSPCAAINFLFFVFPSAKPLTTSSWITRTLPQVIMYEWCALNWSHMIAAIAQPSLQLSHVARFRHVRILILLLGSVAFKEVDGVLNLY